MRTLALDIEVLQEGVKFPDPKDAERPVIAFTLHDSYQDKYITVVQRPDLEEHVEQKDDNWFVLYTNSEEKLFEAFEKLFKMLDPDIVTGWNVFFDLAYIINRARKQGYFNPDDLSPIGRVEIDWNEREVTIAGRHVFDMLQAYKRLRSRPSYTLKYVAKVEGVVEKTEEASDIPDLYENHLERLITYNKVDVQILIELEKVVGILQQALDVWEFVGANDLNEVFYNSIILDIFSLRIAKFKGVVLPSKAHGEKQEYKGAIVFKPVAGLHKNVATLDMNKYYPSIILTMNLSPETLDNPEKEGLAPQIVKLLINLRKKIEAELDQTQPGTPKYELLQRKKLVAKQIVNGFYGYYAYRRSRFFNVDIAATITRVARGGLQVIKQVVEEQGLSVVYGDTDSVFVKLPDELSIEEAVQRAKELEEVINQRLDEYAYKRLRVKKNYLEIEFEKLFSPLLLFPEKKKRYAGRIVYEKGKPADYIKITGFETVRSDTPEAFRPVQATLFEMILRGKSREEIKTYLKTIISKLKKGEFTIEELGIPQGLNKPLLAYDLDHMPPHVRAAVWSNKHLGTKFDKGDKIKVLYVKKVEGYPPTDVIAFTDDIAPKLPKVIIDTNYYLERLRSMTEEILKVAGLSWAEVAGGRTLWGVLGGE